MAYLSLSPVAAAVYAKLNVASMTVLATGGVYDDVPRAPTFPFVLIEVDERDVRGLGTGGFPEVRIRVHAFSQYAGWKEAQSIIQKAIELLRDQALSVSGYTQAGLVFYDQTVSIDGELLAGQKVKELVADFRTYVQEP